MTIHFQASSDDVDDEEFFIKINFDMFALPEVDSNMDISQVRTSAQAFSEITFNLFTNYI